MKKISITSQLILLSLSVVLLVSTIFTAVSLSGIIRFAEEEVYSRLNSYASIIKTNPNNNYPGQENMDTEFYIVENNEKYQSFNISEMIDEDKLLSTIEEIKTKTIPNRGGIVYRSTLKKDGDTYYYVFMSNNEFD